MDSTATPTDKIQSLSNVVVIPSRSANTANTVELQPPNTTAIPTSLTTEKMSATSKPNSSTFPRPFEESATTSGHDTLPVFSTAALDSVWAATPPVFRELTVLPVEDFILDDALSVADKVMLDDRSSPSPITFTELATVQMHQQAIYNNAPDDVDTPGTIRRLVSQLYDSYDDTIPYAAENDDVGDSCYNSGDKHNLTVNLTIFTNHQKSKKA